MPSLQDYLPKAIQPTFQSLVLEFVYLPWKHAHLLALPQSSQQVSQASHPHVLPVFRPAELGNEVLVL